MKRKNKKRKKNKKKKKKKRPNMSRNIIIVVKMYRERLKDMEKGLVNDLNGPRDPKDKKNNEAIIIIVYME